MIDRARTSQVQIGLHGSSGPRAARLAVSTLMVGAGEVLRGNAALVVSELVTNALQAAAGECVLAVTYDSSSESVRLEVGDSSPQLPVVRVPDHRPGGYGLQIVDGLSDEWGVSVGDDGTKVVWAVVTADSDRS